MKHATVILSGLWLTVGLAYAQAPTPSAPQRQSAAAAADEGPTEVVQEAAQGLLSEIDRDRDAYRHDPAKVQQLVGKHLLPHFDTESSARVVLGVHWRNATPESASTSSTRSLIRCSPTTAARSRPSVPTG